ncbi:hypothetical protein D3C75_890330 [compost metagenome]
MPGPLGKDITVGIHLPVLFHFYRIFFMVEIRPFPADYLVNGVSQQLLNRRRHILHRSVRVGKGDYVRRILRNQIIEQTVLFYFFLG